MLEKEDYDLSGRALREFAYEEHVVCEARVMCFWLNKKFENMKEFVFRSQMLLFASIEKLDYCHSTCSNCTTSFIVPTLFNSCVL